MRKLLTPLIQVWLPIAIAITGMSGLVYVSGQQQLRQAANDPQIQRAEDYAAELTAGSAPESIISSKDTDLTYSLSTFEIIYDSHATPIAYSGLIAGKPPVPPAGTFEYTQIHGQDRFTWQPQTGTRFAAVMVKFNSGYVLVGRSLREVEIREQNLLTLTFLAWFATSGASLALVVVSNILLRSKPERSA